MGLIRPSFLGTRGSPACTKAAARSPSHLEVLQVGQGLAPVHTNYSNIYPGFETFFRSSSASLIVQRIPKKEGPINPINFARWAGLAQDKNCVDSDDGQKSKVY